MSPNPKEEIQRVRELITSGDLRGKWAHNLDTAIGSQKNLGTTHKARTRTRVFRRLHKNCSRDFFIACCCCLSCRFITRHDPEGLEMVIAADERKPVEWPDKVFEVIRKQGLADVQNDEYKSFLAWLVATNTETMQRESTTPDVPCVAQMDIDVVAATDLPCSVEAIQAQVKRYLGVEIGSIPLLADTKDTHWTPYTYSKPQIFAASACWTGSPPSSFDLFERTIDGLRKTRPLINGATGTAMEALYQALYPYKARADPRNHVVLLDIPGDNKPKLHYPYGPRNHDIPERMSNFVTEGGKVNFHIDGGMEGLSAALDSTKLWFLAPPSPKNLARLCQNDNLEPSEYEHCVMTVTGSDQVLYLPSGTIHATVTLRGGFLTGISFVDQCSIQPAFTCFIHSLRKYKGEYLEGDFTTFITTLRHALDGDESYRQQAIDLWEDNKNELQTALTKQGLGNTKRSKKGDHWDKVVKLLKEHNLEP